MATSLKRVLIRKPKKALLRVMNKIHTKVVFDIRFVQKQRSMALSLLRAVEAQKGKTDRKLIKQCDEYARDVLGRKSYAPWLYLYTAVHGGFREGLIPNDYYLRVVLPKTRGDLGLLGNRRVIQGKLFDTTFFPDRAYYANGVFTDVRYNFVAPADIKRHLFGEHDKVVFKLNKSARGAGVYIFTNDTFDAGKVMSLGNGVFQSFIDQHEFFNQFTTDSVATVRILTVVGNTGEVSWRAGFLRVGRKGQASVKSTKALRIAINKSGELSDICYFPNMQSVDKYPDSDVAFAGLKIPHFEQCVAAVEKLHSSMPLIRCMGWDLVVNRNNQVEIMECNCSSPGTKFIEATSGPCFAGLGWENLWKSQ